MEREGGGTRKGAGLCGSVRVQVADRRVHTYTCGLITTTSNTRVHGRAKVSARACIWYMYMCVYTVEEKEGEEKSGRHVEG